MRKVRRKRSSSAGAPWTFYFLTYFVCLTAGNFPPIAVAADDAGNCPHPTVPYAATYLNITGGPDSRQWKIKYNCDSGYELFGEDVAECTDGRWRWDPDFGSPPKCAVNVARNKPASSSSMTSGGHPGNAVDGKVTTVHEGKRCSETKSEKSPWWTVDLLETFAVDHVRLTTRCCDDVPIRKAEIRVGNSTKASDNQLCNWIPKALKEGSTETLECVESLVGRYVTITMTGVETVLSLCEVQVFSAEGLSPKSLCSSETPDLDRVEVFQDKCYLFLDQEVSGYESANAECQKNSDDFHLLDHLTELRTQYVTSRLDREHAAKGQVMAWIGALRSEEASFGKELWSWTSDGSDVTEISWGKGQPNHYNKDQNCAVLDSELNWGWNDISCRISGLPVCMARFARCPSPPVAEGSLVEAGQRPRGVGEELHYFCPVGEKPVGDLVQTCLPSGQWSGSPIGCVAVECGKVPGLANGEIHVIDGRTNWGARVRYKCQENYSLMEGDAERICTEDGWSGKHPECVYTKCPEPEFVRNADVQYIGDAASTNRLGSRLVYTCHTGYKASGSLSRECQVGGIWSGTPPQCTFVDCGDPPLVDNGKSQLLDGRTTYGAEVEYACQSDYLPVGDALKRCESNGRWSSGGGSRNGPGSNQASLKCEIIKCPPPRAPSGGRVAGYNREVHSTIDYSCLDGHILEGDERATCTRSGLWSSRTPSCRYVECPQLSRLKSGTTFLVNGTTHIGSIVRYTCDRSHTLQGLEERACLPTGRWSGDPPSCSEIRCKLPERPNNTVISVSSTERLHGTSVLRSKLSMKISYRVGSILKYRCERGYILQIAGQREAPRVANRRCTTAGDWTGSQPSCKYVDCGMPPLVENSAFALQNNGTTFGAVATYQCDDHFNLEGSAKVICGSKNRWEPESPTCVETLCKSLTSPNNGSMVLTTLRIGGRATFQCDFGFGLKGDDDLECLSSGSWSSWPPSCVQIDCGQPLEVDNGRVFLTNGSTTIGSVIEYHCFPGYERDGPFERSCLIDGYWSGIEPSCQKPRPILTILSDNTVEGTTNVRAPGTRAGDTDNRTGSAATEEASGAGLYIGIALGLIVVIGLMILGIYFYRKQKAITSKPPPAPYRDRNANNGIPGYTTSLYHTGGSVGGGSDGVGGGVGVGPLNGNGPSLGQRPPPPIQMYSMDDSGGGTMPGNGLHPEDHRGPIYDTINDDSSGKGSAGGYSRSSGRPPSDHSGYGGRPSVAGLPPPPAAVANAVLPPVPPPQQSTFSPNAAAPSAAAPFSNGHAHSHANGGYSHDYDIPEGSDSGRSHPPPPSNGGPPGGGGAGGVTINGIAV